MAKKNEIEVEQVEALPVEALPVVMEAPVLQPVSTAFVNTRGTFSRAWFRQRQNTMRLLRVMGKR